MFDNFIYAPNNWITLRPHLKYDININRTCRARYCCDGSKRAAPMMRWFSLTYSSYIEHPVQRLFLAIAAHLELRIYGGNTSDNFAYSTVSSVPTFVSIYDQFIIFVDKNLERMLIRQMLLLYWESYKVICGQVDFGKHLWYKYWKEWVSVLLSTIELYTDLSTILMEKLSTF